jgi:hypothetical protein
MRRTINIKAFAAQGASVVRAAAALRRRNGIVRALTLTPASVGDAAEIVLLADALAAIWISVGLVVVAAI